MEGTWTIGELAERAAAALAGEPPVQVSGRVRELPNERLIRWYTTIGLLDPPLARRGRTALYGPRHLLQLVAVKRRQAAGLAIAEIQAELAGAPDDALRGIARLPGPATAADADGARAPDETDDTDKANEADEAAIRMPRSRDRFWTEPPAVAAGRGVRPLGRPIHAAAAYTEAETGRAQPGLAEALDVVPGIRLTPGVTLLLDAGSRPVTEADLAAIAAAARPLLDELRSRGLHPAGTEPAAVLNDQAPPTAPGRHSS